MAPILCGCGCGRETSGTEFRQGHDAKRKSYLLKVARGKEEGNVSLVMEELERRGWTKFL
jgi:hypothetical protein